MKVRLDKDMQLVITPEDWVEQAALSRWVEIHKGESGLLIEAYKGEEILEWTDEAKTRNEK